MHPSYGKTSFSVCFQRKIEDLSSYLLARILIQLLLATCFSPLCFRLSIKSRLASFAIRLSMTSSLTFLGLPLLPRPKERRYSYTIVVLSGFRRRSTSVGHTCCLPLHIFFHHLLLELITTSFLFPGQKYGSVC